jgi:uncharacterized membrane protein
MLTAARFLEFLALGLWLGGMVSLAFIVAPAAFATLPTREQAGNLVGLLLPRFYLLGTLCAAAYLIGLVLEQRVAGGSVRGLLLPVAFVAVALLIIVYSHYGLGERLAALRAEMTSTFGSVDATPRDHALRRAFGRLHGFSSILLSFQLLIVLTLLLLSVRRLR